MNLSWDERDKRRAKAHNAAGIKDIMVPGLGQRNTSTAMAEGEVAFIHGQCGEAVEIQKKISTKEPDHQGQTLRKVRQCAHCVRATLSKE